MNQEWASRSLSLMLLAALVGCATTTPHYVTNQPQALTIPEQQQQQQQQQLTQNKAGTPSVVRSQTPTGPSDGGVYPAAVGQWSQYQSPPSQANWSTPVVPATQTQPAWDPYQAPAATNPGSPWEASSPPAAVRPVQWDGPIPPPSNVPNYPPPSAAGTGTLWPGTRPVIGPGIQSTPISPVFGAPIGEGNQPGVTGVPTPLADVIVNVQEAQTGKLTIGGAVNSDAGLTGQIILDERNFNWRRIPTSWSDWSNAFRGAGQGFRLEALPGSQFQRYMLQFTEPYFLESRVSFNVSAYLFDRSYFDWDEQRLGGRIGFGYRITPDLSAQIGARLEEVKVTDPRVPGVAELDAALGDSELYAVRFSLTQDTRDIPFAPTQGYYLDIGYEQVFGTFDYPRASIDFRRYFLVTQRPDRSGRHVLGFSNRLFVSGSQTPIFENYFAGGYSSLRGFSFRGATPKVGGRTGVAVGGELMLLGSVEYRFPVTADDMLQAVVFCDYGTVEEDIDIDYDDYRVALGAGLRISVPALAAAPIALDFAVPVARENTDEIQNFAFFVGVSR